MGFIMHLSIEDLIPDPIVAVLQDKSIPLISASFNLFPESLTSWGEELKNRQVSFFSSRVHYSVEAVGRFAHWQNY
jgi:hypothetical protein